MSSKAMSMQDHAAEVEKAQSLGEMENGKSPTFANLRADIIKDETDEPEGFEYKEVSEISEVTQESYPEGYVVTQAGGAVEDLVDFDKLVQ